MDDAKERDAAERDYRRMLDDLAAGPLQAEYIKRITDAAGVTPAQFTADFEAAKARRHEAARAAWRDRVGSNHP